MASTPKWKVYAPDGEYVAAAKYPALAAAVVANLGDGATVRYGHGKVVWTEGIDGQAGESYDVVADTCEARARNGQAQDRRPRRCRGGLERSAEFDWAILAMMHGDHLNDEAEGYLQAAADNNMLTPEEAEVWAKREGVEL